MLPFPKRKAHDDEVELDDDDIVLVDDAAPPSMKRTSARVSAALAGAGGSSSGDEDLAATVQRRLPATRTMPPPGSRRILDEELEEDIAGQCLAQIAVETSRDGARALARDPYSSSHIRAAMARPASAPPAAPLAYVPSHFAAAAADPRSQSSRLPSLPSVSAPPFLRTSTVPLHGYADAPGMRDSSRHAAFVRRSSPSIPAIPVSAPSSFAALTSGSPTDDDLKLGSVAPVSLGHRPNEPTVIVVRERPRAAWIVAAAAIGALAAMAATRFLALPGEGRAPISAAAAQAPLAPPPAVVTPAVTPVTPVTAQVAVAAPAPLAVAAPATPSAAPAVSGAPAPRSSAAIVHFGDDEGVAIKASAPPPRKPAPAPGPASTGTATAPRAGSPRAPSMGPALPDGSFGLGRADSTAPSAAPPAAAPLAPFAPLAPAPEPPRRRALTPEQQLADAQLKASMK